MTKTVLRWSGIVLGASVVLVLILFGAAEVTSRPSFCSTCHYMEPYVEAWKTSTHSSVTCTDCHYRPGWKSHVRGKFTALSMVVNYFTGVYKKSKPWAEIDDASCLRSGCHEARLLEGMVPFREGILFDHRPHLIKLRRGKKLRCTSCHSQIVQGEHITVTTSTCFLCHFKNQPEQARIDNCTWCHPAPVATPGRNVRYDHSYVLQKDIECQKCHGPMQVGDGAVPIERCSACHAEVEKIRMHEDIDLMHKTHVTDHKVECQICHLAIQHKSVSRTIAIMPECQSCHTQSHQAQLDLFAGLGGKNVVPHPNPMFEGGLNCQACHIFHRTDTGFEELGHTVVARDESCEKCHGQGYGKVLKQWKDVMKEKIGLLERALDDVTGEVSGARGEARRKAGEHLKDARFNVELVEEGNIVHNVAFADELLVAAHESLKKALDAAGSDVEIPDISIYSTVVPSECKNCHYGQEEIDVEVFGVSFSHNIHIARNHLTCSRCHSNMRRHGELVITRSECLSCHHTQQRIECGRCHEIQAGVFEGTADFAVEKTPDVMYDAGLECLSCHEGTRQPVERASALRCSQCHDPDYEDLLLDWQAEITRLIETISSRMAAVQKRSLSERDRIRMEEIASGLQSIKKDGSLGAHNMGLIEETLNRYSTVLDTLIREGVDPGDDEG